VLDNYWFPVRTREPGGEGSRTLCLYLQALQKIANSLGDLNIGVSHETARFVRKHLTMTHTGRFGNIVKSCVSEKSASLIYSGWT
jgi:hypothetical protein